MCYYCTRKRTDKLINKTKDYEDMDHHRHLLGCGRRRSVCHPCLQQQEKPIQESGFKIHWDDGGHISMETNRHACIHSFSGSTVDARDHPCFSD